MFNIDDVYKLLTIGEKAVQWPGLASISKGAAKMLEDINADVKEQFVKIEADAKAKIAAAGPTGSTGATGTPGAYPSSTFGDTGATGTFYTSDLGATGPTSQRTIIGGVPGPAEPATTPIDRRL
jgi:hypothetical protein